VGAAGLGKTYELRYMAELEKQAGRMVQFVRLAELAQTTDGLRSKLNSIAAIATDGSAIYLDALDELMIPVRQSALILQTWIKDVLITQKPFLRISCRSAVWPTGLQSALQDAYGKDSCVFATLLALSETDIASVASAHQVDSTGFASSIQKAGAQVLAQQPLTVEMLLRIHAARGTLPTNRNTLFNDGILLLTEDRADRREYGTNVDVPLCDIIDAAERLACYLLLSGRDTIDLDDFPVGSALGRRELENLRDGPLALDNHLVNAVQRCGLCDSDGPRQFRFAHRQFAEYLAGRRIARLLIHQSKSLLSAQDGWRSGVAGPLRELAAFAAVESPDIAAWVSEYDPEVIGLSDVADDDLRKRATANLIDRFRRRQMTDHLISRGDGLELKGFKYPNAEADLRSVLHERQSGCEDVLGCAIEIIQSWKLSSMSHDLADITLDPTAPLQARTSAGYVLTEIGSAEAKRRLLPLISGDADDQDLELKGLALTCNWQSEVTVPQLLKVLTPPTRKSYYGAYQAFLSILVRENFNAAGNRLEGLIWAQRYVYDESGLSATSGIVKNIATAALSDLDDPLISKALVELILKSVKTHSESPLMPDRHFGIDKSANDEQLLAQNAVVRRKLISAIALHCSDRFTLWEIGRTTPGLSSINDFEWLLNQAASDSLPLLQRSSYACSASMLPWVLNSGHVDAWLAVRTIEPIATHFPCPIVTQLGTEEAETAKKTFFQFNTTPRREEPKKVDPLPAVRIDQALSSSESKDPKFFHSVCRELTLEDDSKYYGFERFISKTPGWLKADEKTRERIVASRRAIPG
jgi:hypothetical protein